MPETPLQPQSPKPFQPISPWVRDLVTDKPKVEAPKLGVPPVVEEPVKEEVKPVVPVTEAPVVAPVTNVTPAATPAPVSNVPSSSPLK